MPVESSKQSRVGLVTAKVRAKSRFGGHLREMPSFMSTLFVAGRLLLMTVESFHGPDPPWPYIYLNCRDGVFNKYMSHEFVR